MSNNLNTVADVRENKGWANGDVAAYVRDQKTAAFTKAKADYLNANPEVGVIVRKGREVFYRFTDGNLQEFSPESVVSV